MHGLAYRVAHYSLSVLQCSMCRVILLQHTSRTMKTVHGTCRTMHIRNICQKLAFCISGCPFIILPSVCIHMCPELAYARAHRNKIWSSEAKNTSNGRHDVCNPWPCTPLGCRIRPGWKEMYISFQVNRAHEANTHDVIILKYSAMQNGQFLSITSIICENRPVKWCQGNCHQLGLLCCCLCGRQITNATKPFCANYEPVAWMAQLYLSVCP